MPTIQVWIVADVDGYLGTMAKPNFRAVGFDPVAGGLENYNLVTGPVEVQFDIPETWDPAAWEISKLQNVISRLQLDTAEKTEALQKRIQELSK